MTICSASCRFCDFTKILLFKMYFTFRIEIELVFDVNNNMYFNQNGGKLIASQLRRIAFAVIQIKSF